MGVRDLYIRSTVRDYQIKSSAQQAYHEWTHFSPALRVSGMRTVRGMGSREKLTSWQYHMGSLFGGMSVCDDRWWGCEGKCRYPDPQGHPIVASPVLVTPCHVHGHPFPLYLQLDKDKGECLTCPFVSLRMYNVVPYYTMSYMRSTAQNCV